MFKLLKITGESLTPEFQEGDFVLVSKIPFLFSPPAPGDIIAFKQPGYGLLIKRIQHVEPDRNLTVLGTRDESLDSRIFGPVKPEDIVGRVIWHIRKT